MNKVMAILFLLGAIAALGLFLGDGVVQVQRQSWTGSPIGEPHTVYLTRSDRAGYLFVGLACMAGFLICAAKIRREDAR